MWWLNCHSKLYRKYRSVVFNNLSVYWTTAWTNNNKHKALHVSFQIISYVSVWFFFLYKYKQIFFIDKSIWIFWKCCPCVLHVLAIVSIHYPGVILLPGVECVYLYLYSHGNNMNELNHLYILTHRWIMTQTITPYYTIAICRQSINMRAPVCFFSLRAPAETFFVWADSRLIL